MLILQKPQRFYFVGHFRQENVAVCWRGWEENVVEIEVFLEGQSKAIQGDLLDIWRYRERSMTNSAVMREEPFFSFIFLFFGGGWSLKSIGSDDSLP